jgi:hypothetical protein
MRDALDVRPFSIHERISTLFSASITAVSESPDLDFESIIGRPARFEVQAELAWQQRKRAASAVLEQKLQAASEVRAGYWLHGSWEADARLRRVVTAGTPLARSMRLATDMYLVTVILSDDHLAQGG